MRTSEVFDPGKVGIMLAHRDGARKAGAGWAAVSSSTLSAPSRGTGGHASGVSGRPSRRSFYPAASYHGACPRSRGHRGASTPQVDRNNWFRHPVCRRPPDKAEASHTFAHAAEELVESSCIKFKSNTEVARSSRQRRRSPRRRFRAAAVLQLLAFTTRADDHHPWLQSGVTRPPPYVPPPGAPPVAYVEGNFTLNSLDFLTTENEIKAAVTFGLRKWISTTGNPPVETNIPVPPVYVNQSDFKLLWQTHDCSRKNSTPYVPPVVTTIDNSLRFDPATQTPINPGWIPGRFLYPDTDTIPVTEDANLLTAATKFLFCVQEYDTSIRWLNDVGANAADWLSDHTLGNPQHVPPGIHITGERTTLNGKKYVQIAHPVDPLTGQRTKPNARLWIVGRVWISLLQLLDKRLNLPDQLVSYMPEIIEGTPDPFALLTDDLFGTKAFGQAFSMSIESMNDISPYVTVKHNLIPVCEDKKIPMKGCGRFVHTLYEYPSHFSDYKLNYFILTRRIEWAERLRSTPTGFWGLELGEANYTWLPPKPVDKGELWTASYYPQTDWRYVNDCKQGSTCNFIPIAPSGRLMHTMISYRSWSHHEAYLNLCAGENLQSPEMCADHKEVCHYNLTCLGGVDAYFARQDVRGNYYFRSAFFTESDDGEFEPQLENTHQTCPPSCCKSRRMCMRTHDVTGSEVPFDRTMLLVFGGRTYVHDYTFPKGGKYTPGRIQDTDANLPGIQSELFWHECEFVNKGDFAPVEHRVLRSCLELSTDEVWRFDTVRNQWQFMKFDTSQSDTSTNAVGTPPARYAHTAQLIIYTRASDPDNVRRQYMYMFGGASMQCRFGLCDDLWRYEIPWAAMAYYPQFPARQWQQGNQWFVRAKAGKLCPAGQYCGRFRHSMVASYDSNFLFVFGGQGIGRWETSLFRYRVYTDMWENMDPSGIKSITRFAIDYNNQVKPQTLDSSHYDPAIDENIPPDSLIRQLCPSCRATKSKRGSGGNLPKGRGDAQMVFFRDDGPMMLFAGFSTEWSYLYPLPTMTGETYTKNASAVARDYAFDTIDPEFERNRYYYEDTWMYTGQLGNLWIKHWYKEGTYERPKARKGHSMVVRRQVMGDAQAILYGGQLQDEPLGDLWTYDIEREPRDRKWQRLDNTFEGTRPAKMAYHSAVWDEPNNEMIVFGGITWVKTDLNETDTRRDRDRRCFKSAKDLPTTFHDRYMRAQYPQWQGEDLFVLKGDPAIAVDMVRNLQRNCDIRRLCCPLANNFPRPGSPEEGQQWNKLPDPANPPICEVEFTEANGCRNLVIGRRDPNGNVVSLEKISAEALNDDKEKITVQYDLIVRSGPARNFLDLTAMRYLCRGICDVDEFIPVFRPTMHLGVWRMRPDVCPNNCTSHGICEFSHCICMYGWTGPDCSIPQCPGSPCYTDPNSMEYHCIECNGRGQCVTDSSHPFDIKAHYGTNEVPPNPNPPNPQGRRCECDAGWTGEDCSMAACFRNCSSTPFVHRGTCWNEFPAEQCMCVDGYEGSYCERKVCLNKCSGHGVCQDGECICDQYWVGPDCSVMTFSPGRNKDTTDELPT